MNKEAQRKLVKMACDLNNRGYTEEAWEVAKVVTLQEIHFKSDKNGDPVFDENGAPQVFVMESTLSQISLDLAAKYICNGLDPQKALEVVSEMCGNCFDAEYIRWFEFGGEIGKQEAEQIVRDRGEWTDRMACEFCEGPIIFKQHELDEFKQEDAEFNDGNCQTT